MPWSDFYLPMLSEQNNIMTKKILIFFCLLFALSFSFVISSSNVLAAGQGAAIEQTGATNTTGGNEVINVGNPLCPANNPNCVSAQSLIGRVINAALGLIGSIALLMFIYGGFIWLTSQGNEKQVETGKNVLLWATIGLAFIFLSYALVRFLLTDVIQAR